MDNNSQFPPSSPISRSQSVPSPCSPQNSFNSQLHDLPSNTSPIFTSTPTNSAKQSSTNNNKVNEAFIWKYELFRLVQSENNVQHFMCTICGKKYKKDGYKRAGYGSLYQHLKAVHNISKNNEMSLVQSSIISDKKDIKKIQDEYNLKLAKWIVSDFQPFTTVDSPSFRSFALCNQEFNLKIPSSSTIKRIILSQYAKERENLKSTIKQNCLYISLVTDIWTAKDKKSYMGVIGSYIDNSFNRQEVLLDFFYIGPHHSGQKIYEHILKTITFYELNQKIVSIVTDNATNNGTAINNLESQCFYEFHNPFTSENNWVRCGCHVINLIAKKITKSINFDSKKGNKSGSGIVEENISPISKLRSLVLKVRTNEASLKEWSLICERIYPGDNSSEIKPPPYDCETRWNSTYNMIQESFKRKDALETYKQLSDLDWNILTEICAVLAPLSDYSNFFQRKSASLPYYFLCLYKIKKYFHSIIENQVQYSQKVISAVKLGLETLNTYYNIASDTAVVMQATIFDPRYKLKTIQHVFPEAIHETVIENLKEGVNKSSDYVYDSSTNMYSNQEDFTGKFFSSSSPIPYANNNLEIKEELEKYLNSITTSLEISNFTKFTGITSTISLEKNKMNNSSALISHFGKFDILKYWKYKSTEFPGLGLLARKILCTPISSCSVERLFSLCRDCIGIRRCSLAPETISMLMFLKYIYEL